MHIDDQLGLANAGVLVRKIRNSVRETSVKSQGIVQEILLAMLCGNPVVGVFSYRLVTVN